MQSTIAAHADDESRDCAAFLRWSDRCYAAQSRLPFAFAEKAMTLTNTQDLDDSSRDVELIAALLSGRGRNSRLLARALLGQYGGLRGLLLADPDQILLVDGVSRIAVTRLQAIPELSRRFFLETLPVGEAIHSPADTAAYLQARIGHLQHELFCCLYLDNRHRVLRFDELFRGTIDGTSVYPREVVKEALTVNAAAVILAHNHPSGVAEPSQADERITRRLKDALALVDIRLLDHLIIGHGETTSLASQGLI